MRSKKSIKMLMALVVLSFCAQSCEKDNFGKFRKHKKNDWQQRDSTSNDSTRNDSTGNDSTKNDSTENDSTGRDSSDMDSTKNDSTGRDSSSNDSTGNGGSTPGLFKEGFLDSFNNTYDVVTYHNPKAMGGVNYYHKSHKVYEWYGSSAPKSVSNLKQLNAYTESDLYFWHEGYGKWLK